MSINKKLILSRESSSQTIDRGDGLNTILWRTRTVQSLTAMVCFGERDMKLGKRVRKPKKRNAWSITWESSRDDYFKDLNRPRVVAILKPQLDSSTIKKLLPILFTSESHLTFGEKIGYGFVGVTRAGFVPISTV